MKQRVHKPDFFILGAAKSGTTALYSFLRQHPEIYMSPVKEPVFFSKPFQIVSNPVDYIDLFNGVSSEKAIGEASHSNMSFPGAARCISAFFLEAKFVVLLRNPADRAFSLYKHMVYFGLEWIGTFEKALAAEEKRCVSESFAKHCPQYLYNYFYFRSGLYGQQIERFLQYYERNRFYFVTFDRFKEEQPLVVKEIYDFLGVDTSFTPVLKMHNVQEGDIRYPFFHFFLSSRWLNPLVRRFGIVAPKTMARLSWRLNSCSKENILPSTRSCLLARYLDDIKKTSQLTGLDLQHWTSE
jgi:hypothetical protein